ncbi:MAG: hypothetical protein PHR25_02010 [Clostridia bacterium]|nr:hypothetical protein [Clostridia bacterium]
MEKKEYITNQFKKTFGKKYENYCITRIYHQLNRNDIQIVTQQLFKRDNGIALADLFFPQINFVVEIDEKHHKDKNEEDEKRTKEIIKNKLASLDEVIFEPLIIERIDVTKDIEAINDEITRIVEIILKKITIQRDNFLLWEVVYNMPKFYIDKGYIDFEENVKFRTVKEVSDLFNMGYKEGSQVTFKHTGFDNEYFWCPKLKLNNNDFGKSIPYTNEITLDGKYIYESSKEKSFKFANDILNDSTQTRFVFGYYRDSSGENMYKFRGVFELDIDKTKEMIENKIYKRVWKKTKNTVDIKKYF